MSGFWSRGIGRWEWGVGVFLVGAAILLPFAATTWHKQIDDQFISITYARELSRTGAIQYSTGERVEGYSNFLYTLQLSAAISSGLDPALIGKLVCVLSGLGVIAAFAAMAPRTFAGGLTTLAVAAWEPLSYWSSVGLETTQYTLFLVLGWGLLATRGKAHWGIAALLLAAMSRHEGTVHVVAASLLVAADRRSASRPAAIAVVLALVALLAYHGCRTWWFGSFLPTPALVKVASVPYTGYGAKQVGAELFTGAGVIVAAILASQATRRIGAVASIPLAIQCGTLVRLSGDWMTEARFTLPGLLAAAAAWTAGGIPRLSGPAPRFAAVLLVVTASALRPTGYGAWTIQLRPGPTLALDHLAWILRTDTPLQEDLTWVVENVPADSSIFVVDAGILGLIPGVELTDARGLNTRAIAEASAAGQAEAYVRSLVEDPGTRPDFYRVARWDDEADSAEAAIPLSVYSRRSEVRYRKGTIDWFHEPVNHLSARAVRARWDELAELLPTLPHIAWRQVVATYEDNDFTAAIRLGDRGRRLWPTDSRFRSLPESASFPGSPTEVEWVDGRGAALYWNGTVRSRWYDRNVQPVAAVVLDVDAPGNDGAHIGIAAETPCGITMDDTYVHELTEHSVPVPACYSSPRYRIHVTLFNDATAPAGDRNAYVRIAERLTVGPGE